ncbi:MAG: dipicolinate synthase subunit DpsA [Acutalibacteraceae bacterium]
MNMETFAVIGGDLRSAYLAGELVADGYNVITSGFDGTDLPPCVTGCTNPSQAIALADAVILPLPVTVEPDTLNAPFSRVRITLDQVLGAVAPSQPVFGGSVSDRLKKECEARGLAVYDYLQREELAVQNAVPTAEGAVQLAMEELPVTLRGARCLVTGYGRVARTLARLLVAMGARVTAAVRRPEQAAWAEAEGCDTIGPDALAKAGDFDVIFNTVPALLFDQAVLAALNRDTLLIDLASRPGGVDLTAAADAGIKTIWALSLPGRVAPKTAGRILKTTILHMLKERQS